MKSVTRKFQTLMMCATLISVTKLPARADEATAGKPGEGHPAGETTTPAPAAPTKDWSVTVGADWYSEYIFRGVDELGHGNSMFDPSLVAKYKGFTAYYYGYFGYGKDARPGNLWYEENDYAVDYTQTLLKDKLALTVGGYWYTYPDAVSGADTFEFYGKAAYNDGLLNPYIQINWDIDTFHTGYGVVGVNHAFDVGKLLKLADGTFTITPMAQLGIDGGATSRRTQANVNWNDILFGFTVAYNFTSSFCVHAGYSASIALNSLNDIHQGNESIVNVGASYAF